MPELATFVTFDNVVNSWRQRALFYLDTTIWGRIWEIIDFLLNLSLCTIYIINTTYVDAHLDPARIPEANRQLEFLLALIFLVQYTVRFVIINGNPRALEHVIVVLGFVSILVGYFWSISNQHIRDSYISQGAMALFVPFRFLRLHYAINRLLAMTPTGPRWLKLSLIKQEAVALAGDIVVVILSFAGLVHSGINWYSQTYHQRAQGFTFLDAIYFIVSKYIYIISPCSYSILLITYLLYGTNRL